MLPNVVIHSRTGICNRDGDIITIFSSGMLVPQLTSGECLIEGFLYRPFRPVDRGEPGCNPSFSGHASDLPST
jgi:hypothetical protein